MILCMGCMEEIDEQEEVCPYCGYHKNEPLKESYYLPPGSIIKGKYIIGKVLGYGGFGITYIGLDAQLNRKIAVKEYLPSDFATRALGESKLTVFTGDATEQFNSGLESFIYEAKRLATFNHISEIVDIYDCFMENKTGYIVMEYLKGHNVKELLKSGKVFTYEEARDIILCVLNGLIEVHKEGIIHRDIAPDNIFITDNGEVKILDFGAARYAATGMSKSLSVILKPGYAPEEQYRAKGDQGPWSDVYATGATFYRMLTGVRPEESIERLVEDHVQPPSKLGILMPENAENALMNSLNIKKENRIQSAQEFKEALEGKTVERIVVKTKKVNAQRFPVWLRGLLAGAAALCTLFVILGLAGVIRLPGGALKSTMAQEAITEQQSYVPDITGMTYDEARKELQTLDLKVVISGKNFSKTIDKDRIVSQSCKDGRVLDKGETLKVVMSGGTEEVMMPDLESSDKDEAMQQIQAQNLVINDKDNTEEYSDYIEKGKVISQSVAADDMVTPGTEIKLVISKGKLSEETAVLKVPDLTGKTKEEAIEVLRKLKEEKGFTYSIGEVTKENSTDVKKGKIMAQNPEAGKKKRTDESIKLLISKGPKMVTVPNVVYTKKDDAVKSLQDLKFTVNTTEEYSDSVESGLIVSQDVKDGKKVAEGKIINIAVSLGKKPAVDTTANTDNGTTNNNAANDAAANNDYTDAGTTYDAGTTDTGATDTYNDYTPPSDYTPPAASQDTGGSSNSSGSGGGSDLTTDVSDQPNELSGDMLE